MTNTESQPDNQKLVEDNTGVSIGIGAVYLSLLGLILIASTFVYGADNTSRINALIGLLIIITPLLLISGVFVNVESGKACVLTRRGKYISTIMA